MTTTASRRQRVAVVLSLTVGALVAVSLAVIAQRPYRSFDTYFHLRFGSEFRSDWTLTSPGQPSAASTNDWVPTQWLSQIALSWIDDVAGDAGLAATLALLCVVLGVTTYVMLRRWTAPAPATCLLAAVLFGMAPSLSLRPQVLSYVLLAIVVIAWDRARRSGRPPYVLVPLAWLWCMLHGMWILGVGLSGILALGLILDQRPDRRLAIRFLAVPGLMAVAAGATPVGPKILGAVLQVNSRGQYFVEWAAPELFTLAGAPLLGLLLLAVILAARRERVASFDLALILACVVFATYSNRTVPAALIVLAAAVATVAGRDLSSERPDGPSRVERLMVGAMALVVVVLASASPQRDALGDTVRSFDAALTALPADGVVLTDSSVGSVLLHLHPELDIPVHGYGDVYTDGELAAKDEMLRVAPGWGDHVAALDADLALLPDDAPLLDALKRSGWLATQEHDSLVLLTPPR